MLPTNRSIVFALALVVLGIAERVVCIDKDDASKLNELVQQDVSTAEENNKAEDEQENSLAHQKQSVWPIDLFWPQRARENPDFFLIWMKPYEPFIPQQIQEMIHQQVSPMTEQISSQIIQSVPGSEQMYQQLQQFMNLFQNFGLQNIMGGLGGGSGGGSSSGSGGGNGGSSGRGNGGLSGLIPSLGRRR